MGNPPILYSLFRHQHHLEHMCRLAESGALPTSYPPPTCLGVHVRAQGATPCADMSAVSVLAKFGFGVAEAEQRVYVETKHDGFRLQAS